MGENTLDVLLDVFNACLSEFQNAKQSTKFNKTPRSRPPLRRQNAIDEETSFETEVQPDSERDDACWWKSRIKRNYDSLQLEMLFENGFEGELMKLNVFDTVVLEHARENCSSPLKIKHLLDNLLHGNESMFEQFCLALSSSHQDHIRTKYLSADSPVVRNPLYERSPPFSSEQGRQPPMRLLDPWKLLNLRNFRNELAQKIISDVGLISGLRSKQVFTDHQLAEVEAERHERSRNQMMLDWLEKCSEETHSKFCDALIKNNQKHLVFSYLLESSPSIAESVTFPNHNRSTIYV